MDETGKAMIETRKDSWQDATSDEERAVRLECLRLFMEHSSYSSSDNVIEHVTKLSNFVLGLVRAEKNV